jgi:hypothetical protein
LVRCTPDYSSTNSSITRSVIMAGGGGGGSPNAVVTAEEQYQSSLPWFVQEFPGQYTATTYNGQLAYKDATGQIISPTNTVLYRPPGWQEYQDALKAAHPGTGENFFDVMKSGFTALAKEPAVGLVISYFLPGVGSAIASELVSAGVMAAGPLAEATGLAIAKTVSGIAQGQSPETALANAVTDAAVNYGSIEVAKVVNGVLSSPAVTNAIVSAGASAVKTAAGGGNEDDVAKAALSGLISSGTTSLVSNAVNASPDIANIVGSAAGGYVAGGEKGAITSALSTAAGQAGAAASKTIPVAETAVFDKNITPEQLSVLKQDFNIPSSPADVQGTQVALGPLIVPLGVGAAEIVADSLPVLIGIFGSKAVNDTVAYYKQQNDSAGFTKWINDNINEALNRKSEGVSLAPTVGGGGGGRGYVNPPAVSTPRVAQTLNIPVQEAAKLQTSNPQLYDAFGGLTSEINFTSADLQKLPVQDRLVLENIASGKATVDVPPEQLAAAKAQPTSAGENVVISVNPDTGDALIISSTGVVTQAKVDPSTRLGTTIVYDPNTNRTINTQTNTITSGDTNTTSRVDINAINNAVINARTVAEPSRTLGQTTTQPISTAVPDTAPKTEAGTMAGPLVTPKTGELVPPALPVTPPPGGPTITADTSKLPADSASAAKKPATTASFALKPFGQADTASPTSATSPLSPLTSESMNPASVTGVTAETVPDEFYKPNIKFFTSKTAKPTTPATTAALGQALGTTTGLTAYRGAGEIEDPSTGKKRKNVWNEETLRLKDALGV